MAARLGVDHQQLQQFVTSSTWDYAQVRRRLARWAEEFIDPHAFVVDDTGFPKDGLDSPGVARMYSGSLGKVGNCQIGVSVHAVTDWASAAIDWLGRGFGQEPSDGLPTGQMGRGAQLVACLRAPRAAGGIWGFGSDRSGGRCPAGILGFVTDPDCGAGGPLPRRRALARLGENHD
jgi:hypothetical protein